MKLNRDQAMELNAGLSQQGLKTKHVSGENFLKVVGAKTKLKNSLNELGEAEKLLGEEYDAVNNNGNWFVEDKDKRKEFMKNLREKQKAYYIELDLNFIPENELKEYCKEQDTLVTAVLFEYLLKN